MTRCIIMIFCYVFYRSHELSTGRKQAGTGVWVSGLWVGRLMALASELAMLFVGVTVRRRLVCIGSIG